MAAATTVLAVTAIASAAVSVKSGIDANNAAKKQAKAINAEAREAANIKMDQIDSFVGNQESAIAASGVDLNAGSSLAVLENTRLEGMKEVDSIRRLGAAKAAQARSQGRQALFGGIAQGIGSLGSAYGNIAGANAANFKPTGATGGMAGGSYLNTGGIA